MSEYTALSPPTDAAGYLATENPSFLIAEVRITAPVLLSIGMATADAVWKTLVQCK